MKITIMMACLLLSMNSVLAAKKGGQPKRNSNVQLGTSFKFDGTTLRGKYQSALGTSATVENDKYLEDLLGGRKSFADRTQEDRERN